MADFISTITLPDDPKKYQISAASAGIAAAYIPLSSLNYNPNNDKISAIGGSAIDANGRTLEDFTPTGTDTPVNIGIGWEAAAIPKCSPDGSVDTPSHTRHLATYVKSADNLYYLKDVNTSGVTVGSAQHYTPTIDGGILIFG